MVYKNSKNTVDELVLNGVLSLVRKGKSWSGTMSDLNSVLTSYLISGQGSVDLLPGSPSALRVVLNRVVGRLRIRGISVRFSRTTDRMRSRLVKFTR